MAGPFLRLDFWLVEKKKRRIGDNNSLLSARKVPANKISFAIVPFGRYLLWHIQKPCTLQILKNENFTESSAFYDLNLIIYLIITAGFIQISLQHS